MNDSDFEIQNSDLEVGQSSSMSTGQTLVDIDDIDGKGDNANANVASSENTVLTSRKFDSDLLNRMLCEYHMRLQQRTERCLVNLRSGGDLRFASGGSTTSLKD
jgi:hypothetical protein